MGSSLGAPTRTKHEQDGGQYKIRYGVSNMQGWRKENEDAHVCITQYNDDPQHCFFGVFDGHGGSLVAHYVAKFLPERFFNHADFKSGDITSAMRKSFMLIDYDLTKPKARRWMARAQNIINQQNNNNNISSLLPSLDNISDKPLSPIENNTLPSPHFTGSTAVCLYYNTKTRLICWANLGDSRIVIATTSGNIIQLTNDHKPSDPIEKARIESAGGTVENNRINGVLNLSRALGDWTYKSNRTMLLDGQQIIAKPEVGLAIVDDEIDIAILGCDGIWERPDSSFKVGEFLWRHIDGCTSYSSTISHMLDLLCADPILSAKFKCLHHPLSSFILGRKTDTTWQSPPSLLISPAACRSSNEDAPKDYIFDLECYMDPLGHYYAACPIGLRLLHLSDAEILSKIKENVNGEEHESMTIPVEEEEVKSPATTMMMYDQMSVPKLAKEGTLKFVKSPAEFVQKGGSLMSRTLTAPFRMVYNRIRSGSKGVAEANEQGANCIGNTSSISTLFYDILLDMNLASPRGSTLSAEESCGVGRQSMAGTMVDYSHLDGRRLLTRLSEQYGGEMGSTCCCMSRVLGDLICPGSCLLCAIADPFENPENVELLMTCLREKEMVKLCRQCEHKDTHHKKQTEGDAKKETGGDGNKEFATKETGDADNETGDGNKEFATKETGETGDVEEEFAVEETGDGNKEFAADETTEETEEKTGDGKKETGDGFAAEETRLEETDEEKLTTAETDAAMGIAEGGVVGENVGDVFIPYLSSLLLLNHDEFSSRNVLLSSVADDDGSEPSPVSDFSLYWGRDNMTCMLVDFRAHRRSIPKLVDPDDAHHSEVLSIRQFISNDEEDRISRIEFMTLRRILLTQLGILCRNCGTETEKNCFSSKFITSTSPNFCHTCKCCLSR